MVLIVAAHYLTTINDPAGAPAYARDVPDAEVVLLHV
jgi:hypothetical protein